MGKIKLFPLFRVTSIKKRIIINFSILIICSIAVTAGTTYWLFANSYRSELTNSTSKLVDQITMNLDTYLSEVETSLKIISRNDVIISSLNAHGDNDSYQNLKNSNTMRNLFNDVIKHKPDIYNIMVFNRDWYINANQFVAVRLDSQFIKQVLEINEKSPVVKPFYFGTHKPDYFYNANGYQEDYDVSVTIPIRNLDSPGGKTLGIAMFEFNFLKIKQIFDNFNSNDHSKAFIIDESRNIVYSSNEQLISTPFNDKNLNFLFNDDSGARIVKINDTDTVVAYSTANTNGWKVVILIELSSLEKNLVNTQYLIIIISIIAIIIALVIASFISSGLLKPIMGLVSKMRLIGQGDFSIRAQEHKSLSEINTINNGFNNMMDQINLLIKQVYDSKLRQKEAEFSALQAKINPHFLNNTLQTITSLAVLERTRDIKLVTNSLSQLLEYVIYQENEFVRPELEIAHIQSYMKIQNIRFNNMLNVVYELDKEVSGYYILKLMLQPLVENAIIHGWEKIGPNATIKITGRKVGGELRFEVSDNGSGISDVELERINALLLNQGTSEGHSIGLCNINERIRNKFGTYYGLKIESELGKGTTVKVSLPAVNNVSETVLAEIGFSPEESLK